MWKKVCGAAEVNFRFGLLLLPWLHCGCYGYSGTHHLGYSNAEIFGKSWYELLHPEDVVEAKEKHVQRE